MTDTYELRRVEQMLAEDGDVAELGIHLSEHGDHVLVRGQVASNRNGERVIDAVRRAFPDKDVMDELICVEGDLSSTPRGTEEIR
jgi:hypothetical protein